jgi:hypothetical protein
MDDVHKILLLLYLLIGDNIYIYEFLKRESMSHFPLIVSYYIKDELPLKGLLESCEKYNLAYHIEPVESFGSAELNASYKPFFLLSKLQEFKRPLFWVDPDGAFVQKPLVLEEFSADLAVRINTSCQPNHPSKVLSGSIFVNATDEAKALLRQWASECYRILSDPGRTQEFYDQAALRDTIFGMSHRATVVPLPHAYMAIEGHLVDQKEIARPVILHKSHRI